MIVLIYKFILSVILLVISYKDFKEKIISDKLVKVIFLTGVIYKLTMISTIKDLCKVSIDSFLGFLVGGGILLIISIATNGGVGGGDIKLMCAVGFLAGLNSTYFIVMFSFLIGSIVTFGIKMIDKVKNRIKNKTTLPYESIAFGPFIALGTFLTII